MFLGGVAPMPNVQLGVQAVTPNQVTNIANAGNVQNNYTINVTAPNGDPQAIADVIRRELDNRDRIARAGGVPTRRF
jgi:predicted Zn-dependent peptidase